MDVEQLAEARGVAVHGGRCVAHRLHNRCGLTDGRDERLGVGGAGALRDAAQAQLGGLRLPSPRFARDDDRVVAVLALILWRIPEATLLPAGDHRRQHTVREGEHVRRQRLAVQIAVRAKDLVAQVPHVAAGVDGDDHVPRVGVRNSLLVPRVQRRAERLRVEARQLEQVVRVRQLVLSKALGRVLWGDEPQVCVLHFVERRLHVHLEE
mmetsp:Transcript_38269/g.95178  ORF Transcript_38269/g.95178 Transcript_38269/m.95178 type:complete len:209 (+) Transcript_38269:3031-3657(+)